jgi:hypothetical protein
MKNRYLLATLLIVSSFVVGLSFQAPSSSAYEYKFENGITEKKANELGAQGWELAAIQSPAGVGMGTVVPVYVFKRLK